MKTKKFSFGLDALQICYRWTCIDCDLNQNTTLDNYQFERNFRRLEALKSLQVIDDGATNFDAATMHAEGFYLVRVHSPKYKYCYNINVFEDYDAEGKEIYNLIGTLGFENRGLKNDSDNYFDGCTKNILKVWLRVENKTLYNRSMLLIPYVTETYGFVFNNITCMDLHLDSTVNFAKLIRRICKDEDLSIIFNGKEVQDRKKYVKELKAVYGGSFWRLDMESLYLKEKKADKSKTSGHYLHAYDKSKQLDGCNKNYISEPFGKSRIYRLEVHLNWDDIKNYIPYADNFMEFGFVLNEKLLYYIFCDTLDKIIHFRFKRKKIDWFTILRLELGIDRNTLIKHNLNVMLGVSNNTPTTTRKKHLKPLNSIKKAV